MAGFTLIEDQVLGSAAASITFNTGLTDYTKFRLTLYVIADGSNKNVSLRINGDTGNYADEALMASSTSVTGTRDTAQTSVALTEQGALKASQTALITIEISKPLSSVPARATYQTANMDAAATSAVTLNVGAAEWSNTTDLISSISILASAGDFAANTRAVLEGAA